jgi:NADH-quinone oxidoreductase subunit H
VLAELNRTPFDLGEAERELVSGVNIEYRGGTFGVLFIREYFNIIVLRVLSSALLTGAAASRLIRAVFRGLLIYLLV